MKQASATINPEPGTKNQAFLLKLFKLLVITRGLFKVHSEHEHTHTHSVHTHFQSVGVSQLPAAPQLEWLLTSGWDVFVCSSNPESGTLSRVKKGERKRE